MEKVGDLLCGIHFSPWSVELKDDKPWAVPPIIVERRAYIYQCRLADGSLAVVDADVPDDVASRGIEGDMFVETLLEGRRKAHLGSRRLFLLKLLLPL